VRKQRANRGVIVRMRKNRQDRPGRGRTGTPGREDGQEQAAPQRQYSCSGSVEQMSSYRHFKFLSEKHENVRVPHVWNQSIMGIFKREYTQTPISNAGWPPGLAVWRA
jgi:hypothetical protein